MKPPVIWHPSPNFNSRKGAKIDCIVVHHTGSANAQGSLEWMSVPISGVSAHYLIRQDGVVHQLVKDEDRAWHAGICALRGDAADMNSRSIGVELANPGNGKTPFTEAQYTILKALLEHLVAEYSIPWENVVGHKEVAIPKGRKDDPADNFDWSRVLPAGVRHAV
jgi:N-acetylmuramoyl-L-alanine amidase